MKKYLKVGIPEVETFSLYKGDFNKIISSKLLSNAGPYHNEFIKLLSKYLLTKKKIILFANATLALLASLKVVCKANDEIITTPFSFIATNSVLKFLKIKAKYCDINPQTYNIDFQKLKKLITKKTRIIYIVNVFGNPCEILEIEKICKNRNIILIIDNAAGFGSKYKYKSLCVYGNINVTSFHATKIFNTIEGGMIVCDSKYYKELASIQNFGFFKNKMIIDYGLNCKLNELQCSVGINNLKKINNIIKKRKRLYLFYKSILNHNHISFQFVDITNYNFSNLAVNIININIPKFIRFMATKNIFIKRYWDYTFDKNCKVAKNVSMNIVCLPLNSNMNKNDVKYICNNIFKFLE